MYRFIYGLMGGEHEELPRRRFHDEAITFDPHEGTFVTEPPVAREGERWLGRGEVPGAPIADAAGAGDGQSVADEVKQLLREHPKP